MATKSKAAEQAAEVTEVTAQETDPFKRMVEIRIPRDPNGQTRTRFVAVNGRKFLVKVGQKVMVPEPVAEVLRNSFDAQDAADDFIVASTKEE